MRRSGVRFPSRALRSPWPVVVLVVSVLTVGAIAVVITARSDDGDRTASEPSGDGGGRTTSTSSTTIARSAIDATVSELSRYVEGARGLSFKEPVNVELLDEERFK